MASPCECHFYSKNFRPILIHCVLKMMRLTLKYMRFLPCKWGILSTFLQVFLRDSQHSLLQVRLHSEQIHLVCILQRWIKGLLQRRQFLRQRNAAVVIQVGLPGTHPMLFIKCINISCRPFQLDRPFAKVSDNLIFFCLRTN